MSILYHILTLLVRMLVAIVYCVIQWRTRRSISKFPYKPACSLFKLGFRLIKCSFQTALMNTYWLVGNSLHVDTIVSMLFIIFVNVYFINLSYAGMCSSSKMARPLDFFFNSFCYRPWWFRFTNRSPPNLLLPYMYIYY